MQCNQYSDFIYSTPLPTDAPDSAVDSETEEPGGKKTRLESDYEELFGPRYASTNAPSVKNTCTEEVEEYLKITRIPTTSSPLKWWKQYEKQFPRLAKLVKTYLAVPATSTPSERVFSLAGNTITRQRASLHPGNVDKLIFLNENSRERKTTTTIEDDFSSDESE